MKICLLIWDYWPGLQGGAERQARLVSRELLRRGHNCEVITAWASLNWPKRGDDQGVKIRRVGSLVPVLLAVRRLAVRLGRALSSPRKVDAGFWLGTPWMWLARLDFIIEFLLLCRVGKIKGDIMHLHEPSWLGGLAQLASRWTGCAVICQEATSPALPAIGYDTPLRRLWGRLRLKPIYIGMAQYAVEQLIERGISSERIYLVPSGIPVPCDAAKGAGSNEVLYVANFSQGAAWKAFDVLFDAWALVAREKPEARLSAVGGGDYRPWRTLLESKGVADSVVFTGTVEDIGKYFSKSAIFLLPSRVEGMSNALLEAQMWGLACVVSDIPGNLAVVRDGENGIVVPVGDARRLADAVLKLLRDPELQKRLGREARESAIRNFSIESVGERLVGVYGKVLAGGAQCRCSAG